MSLHSAAAGTQRSGVAASSSASAMTPMLLLAVGHAVTDSYGHSLLTPMFPQLSRQMHLSLDQVGSLPMIMGVSASLAQPILGWISDRHPRLCMVAFGPLFAAFCMGWVGFARSYWELALVLFLAGLGIGAFHPQGATLAKRAGRGKGFAMSAFTVGGNIGFGVAPLLGGLYLNWLGLERLGWSAIPAVVFAVVMYMAFRRGLETPESVEDRPGRHENNSQVQTNIPALVALTATVVVRSAVQIGIVIFLPFLVEQRFAPEQRQVMLSVAPSAVLLASALAGPFGGMLGDRFGRRTVMQWSFLAAPAPLVLAFLLPPTWLLVVLVAGAFLLMLPHPSNVIMAQEYLPHRAGIAASMVTGLAMGLAQLMAVPLGAAADRFGLASALIGLAFFPLIGLLMTRGIPADRSPA